MQTIGVDGLEIDEGTVTVLIHPQEFHYTVHGGVLSTLLDTAAACSVHSTLPAGVGSTTPPASSPPTPPRPA